MKRSMFRTRATSNSGVSEKGGLSDTPNAGRVPGRSWLFSRTFLGIVGSLAVLVTWEVGARAIDRAVLIVPVSEVLADLWQWTSSGEIVEHLTTSGLEFALGFALATVVGIVLGVAVGLSRILDGLLGPLIAAFYSTPTLALAPLLVIWLGFGLSSKIALILMVGVFSILVNTQTGIRQTDQGQLEAVRSFGASRLDLITKVRFPAALPYVFAGMRIGVSRSVVGIFVAEIFGSQSGIGYTIINSAAAFRTARLLSGIIVLAVFGILMVALIDRLSAWAIPWQSADRG